MTWPEFFAQWGIVGLGFVWGIAWKVTRFDDERADWKEEREKTYLLLEESHEREKRLRGWLSASNRLLEQATAQPETDERFDWKRGTGVA